MILSHIPRVIFLSIAVFVGLTVSATAIEKRKKDAPPKPDSTQVVKDMTVKAPTEKAKPAPAAVKKLPAFNDFIDVNNNGIDDRVEKGGAVIVPKRAPAKQQTSVKGADSAKTSTAKKPAAAPSVVSKKPATVDKAQKQAPQTDKSKSQKRDSKK